MMVVMVSMLMARGMLCIIDTVVALGIVVLLSTHNPNPSIP